MKRVILILTLLVSSTAHAGKGDHLLYEGIQRCYNLVGSIKNLENEGNTDVEKHIAKLTQDLRKREYKLHCTNVSTVPAVYEKVCSTPNSFCKTVNVLPVKELVE